MNVRHIKRSVSCSHSASRVVVKLSIKHINIYIYNYIIKVFLIKIK